MSGFTRTPNYSLYKPTPNADNDAWGGHLNTNADILDTLLGPGGSAPFLPLSGGTHSIAESGATGDGVTDDQPAIQAWLNTLTTGAEVLLAPGKWYYIHAAPLTIPKNVTVRGSYNALDNQLVVSGTLFNGGGFLIDPVLPYGILMSSASSLRSCKVYRRGLTANASQAQATTDYGIWAAEAVYCQTSGAMASNATTIPLANTAGITVGMRVLGPGAFGPGGYIATVTAVTTNVSVGISASSPQTVASGAWFRFGPSVGIMLPYNTSGIVLDELTVIGFRTGIVAFPGQYFITKVRADCITNIEACNGNDTATVHNCEFLPLYGSLTGGASRAGDAVFVHDGGVTTSFDNVFAIGWTTGWHCENVQGLIVRNCGSESLQGAGLVNWLIVACTDSHLSNCWAQSGGVGFHVKNCGAYELAHCRSTGYQTTPGNNTAHFLVDGTGFGSLVSPVAYSGITQGKVPISLNTSGANACSVSAPVMYDMAGAAPTAPYVQGNLPLPITPTFAQGVVPQPGIPATGFSDPIPQYWNGAIWDSSGTITSAAMTLPPYPMDNQTFKLWFNVGVTTLTVTTSDGSAVGNYMSPLAGSEQEWIYSRSQNKWFCGGSAGSGTFLPLTGGSVSGAVALGNGVSFGNFTGATDVDLAKHINLYGGSFGFSVTGGKLNYSSGAAAAHSFRSGGTLIATLTATGGLTLTQGLGLFNGTPVTAKPTVTGAKGSNAALASLLAALAAYGLVTDSTSA